MRGLSKEVTWTLNRSDSPYKAILTVISLDPCVLSYVNADNGQQSRNWKRDSEGNWLDSVGDQPNFEFKECLNEAYEYFKAMEQEIDNLLLENK